MLASMFVKAADCTFLLANRILKFFVQTRYVSIPVFLKCVNCAVVNSTSRVKIAVTSSASLFSTGQRVLISIIMDSV